MNLEKNLENRMRLHAAHVLAAQAAGVRLRAVCLLEDGEIGLLLMCARSRSCIHCRSFLGALALSYIEVGLVHEVTPPTAPAQPEPLPEGASV